MNQTLDDAKMIITEELFIDAMKQVCKNKGWEAEQISRVTINHYQDWITVIPTEADKLLIEVEGTFTKISAKM